MLHHVSTAVASLIACRVILVKIKMARSACVRANLAKIPVIAIREKIAVMVTA